MSVAFSPGKKPFRFDSIKAGSQASKYADVAWVTAGRELADAEVRAM
jgi:hypothetical protein